MALVFGQLGGEEVGVILVGRRGGRCPIAGIIEFLAGLVMDRQIADAEQVFLNGNASRRRQGRNG